VYAAGVSRQALRDAAARCGMFKIIVRRADTHGWDGPTGERLQQRAPAMLEGGYVMRAIGDR
jgi:hypothetical protein